MYVQDRQGAKHLGFVGWFLSSHFFHEKHLVTSLFLHPFVSLSWNDIPTPPRVVYLPTKSVKGGGGGGAFPVVRSFFLVAV